MRRRFDLGWKLAWVLRGWAGAALLDTYEAERRPVVEHVAARSADPGGSRRAAEQEVHADLGGRIPHVWTDGRSTLDLLGTGLTLFAGRDDAAWEAVAASPRPDRHPHRRSRLRSPGSSPDPRRSARCGS